MSRRRRENETSSQGDPTIDLHGLRVEAALARLDPFLRAEHARGTLTVRIITGIGTGAMRTAVRSWLGSHPLVASWRPGLTQQDAITVVDLRPPKRPGTPPRPSSRTSTSSSRLR